MLLRIGSGDGFAQQKFSIERTFSMDNFLHAPFPEEPLDFYGQSKERTNHELGLLQSSGVNHQVQFVADAESNASNTLNSGYCGYDNGEDLVKSYLELYTENWHSQNCELLDKEFGNTHAPIAIEQDHVLQSQSCVKNYGELPFDASILDVGSEECTREDCPQLPNMENDKQEETSTSIKQNLVADSPLTNESPAVLSAEERRKQYNRESARRSRANKKARADLFEELRPFLRKIAKADTGNLTYETILLQRQLKYLIANNEVAAIAFGESANMMRRSPSSLHKGRSGM